MINLGCHALFMAGQLQEDVFERHGDGLQFEEPPLIGDDEPGDLITLVLTQRTFQEERAGGLALKYIQNA